MGTVSFSSPELGAVHVPWAVRPAATRPGYRTSSRGAAPAPAVGPDAAACCPGHAGSPLGSAQRRSKKQRAGSEAEASEPSHSLPAGAPRPATVLLRAPERDQHAVISGGGLALASSHGYRSVQATHGVHAGAWYFEVQVRHLGSSGAARIGWATAAAEQQGPVGGDRFGYAYRSLEGLKVHRGVREPYGAGWGEGDVVGCLIHLPRPKAKPGQGTVVMGEGGWFEEEGLGPLVSGWPGSHGLRVRSRQPGPGLPCCVMGPCAQRGDDKTFLVLSARASWRRHD